jgi:hypothetical protein
MSIPYEEKKKLIESAKELKEYCRYIGPDNCVGCLFLVSGFCELENVPNVWKIPKLTRWTPEDLALAKALSAVGVDTLEKAPGSKFVRWEQGTENSGWLPNGVFQNLGNGERVKIDTIIEEAEV